MSSTYVAKEWDITSVPTAVDFNRIEAGIRAITPQLLYDYTVDGGEVYQLNQTMVLREPITNFQRIQFVRGMYASYATNKESHIIRVAGTTSIYLGGSFRQNTNTGVIGWALAQSFSIASDKKTLTMTLAKVLNLFGGSADFTITNNYAGIGITHVYGLNRIAG